MKNSRLSQRKAQTAIEYMLLLGVVVAIVLVSFKVYIPRIRGSSNVYLNRTATGMLGKGNPCGDGICDPVFEGTAAKCPVDCS